MAGKNLDLRIALTDCIADAVGAGILDYIGGNIYIGWKYLTKKGL
jgi:hypothetical protein